MTMPLIEPEDGGVERGLLARRVGRRRVLHALGLGAAALGVAPLLAACGGDDDDEDEATPTAATTSTTPAAGASPTVAAATATTASSPAAETGSGGIINIVSTAGDKATMNPILVGADIWVSYMTFNRLLVYDDVGTLRPELADSWAYSDDNLTLTLTLAEATWQDGEAFDAEDVIFTFETIQAETTETILRSRLQISGEFIGWEQIDPRTVQITTAEPFAPLLLNLNEIPIIPQHLLAESSDINTDAFNTSPIGTGAFRVVERAPDQFVKLERYPEHWRGPAKADGFTIVYKADQEVGAVALDAGEVDLLYIYPEFQARYENKEGVTLHKFVFYSPITLAFNHKHPIVADVNVRRAISLAIDKAPLTESVTKGLGRVASNQFAESGPLDRYNDYENVLPLTFSVEEANKILDDAGYAMGPDGVRVTPDGAPMFLNVVSTPLEEYQNDQVLLQAMLGEIGIELGLNSFESTTIAQMHADPNEDPETRALEVAVWPLPFEFDPDLYNEMHSDNFPPGSNVMYFKDDEVDRLIIEGRTTTDPDARVAIYKQLDVRRAEVLPAVPLYNVVDGIVVANTVKGIKETPNFNRSQFIENHLWWKEA